MQMSASMRLFAVTAHVTTSVGWRGAVACFLALAVVGLTSPQPLEVQAAYVLMELICWMIIVSLSLLSPPTGIAQSPWTPRGMLKHYWVVVKLVVTLPCTAILLLHMLPTTRLASVALQGGLAGSAMHDLRVQLVRNASIFWRGGPGLTCVKSLALLCPDARGKEPRQPWTNRRSRVHAGAHPWAFSWASQDREGCTTC